VGVDFVSDDIRNPANWELLGKCRVSPELQKAILKAIDEDLYVAELEPLGVEYRAVEALGNRGINLVSELIMFSKEELGFIENLGPKGRQKLREVVLKLDQLEEKKKEHQEKLSPDPKMLADIRTYGLDRVLNGNLTTDNRGQFQKNDPDKDVDYAKYW
jgi:hypothetical protein